MVDCFGICVSMCTCLQTLHTQNRRIFSHGNVNPEKMVRITIFTPTYNRAYILPKLYESLRMQTCKDFEWLIVDDGSTDDTECLVKSWLSETAFPVRYIQQENGGKHRAINRGVQDAQGELFFIVDSDDHLTEDAVEWIINQWQAIRDDNSFAGLSGIRITPDGHKIGGGEDFGTIDTDALSIRSTHHVHGDLAEIYRTDVLRRYRFMEVPGEKFCPEALVWNRIARDYKLRYVHHPIYVCAYRPDGLTAKITRIRHESPITSMVYYIEYTQSAKSTKERSKAKINYWRFAPVKFSWLLYWPLGFAMKLMDNLKK